jgi:hypothetical protein
MPIEAVLVGVLILAPFAALGVIGVAVARYAGPSRLVRSLRPFGWPLVAVAAGAIVVWLLAARFLEI